MSARTFVVIVDDSKLVERLGRGALPVEMVPFLWRETAVRLQALGATCQLRRHGSDAYLTDNNNLILDLLFDEPIADAAHLAARIKGTPGVVEHGLFIGVTAACIVADGGDRITGGPVDRESNSAPNRKPSRQLVSGLSPCPAGRR